VNARTTRALALAAVIATAIIVPLGLKNYGIYLLSLWALYAIAAQGLNLTLGYAGQISLAQAAFFGVGAYISALATTSGVSFWLAVPLAGLACFSLGALIGFPALRVQHHYLAFVTLAFNVLVFLVLRNEQWLTGGTYGISGIPRPSLFGFSLGAPLAFYYLCLGLLCVMTVAFWHILRSPWGRAFAALRDNPERAASLGVSLMSYTLLAFAIGSAEAGIAGAVFAPLVEFIDPTPFTVSMSLAFLLMVVVGGQGTLTGPFIGAALVTLLPEWLRWSEGYYLMLYALAVMVLMVVCPSGLTGLARMARRRWERAQ